MSQPQTLFEKVWNAHVVAQEPDSPAVLYIDLHLVHEVTSPQAFTGLRGRGLKVRRPDKTLATMDHSIPTHDPSLPILDELAAKQIRQMEINAKEFGITLHGMTSPHRGIVHVIGPELGLTQPGTTIVCGDSHTSTHGAFGALAFGIGTSEVEMVLASQCLLQRKPKTCEVRVEGGLGKGVSSKDIILALIAKIGVGGGTGHVLEYTGPAIRALTMEQRMTICNMSIEGGARAGTIAPDDSTFDYIAGREFAPKGEDWEAATVRWRRLPTDDGATDTIVAARDAAAAIRQPGIAGLIIVTGVLRRTAMMAAPFRARVSPAIRIGRGAGIGTVTVRRLMGKGRRGAEGDHRDCSGSDGLGNLAEAHDPLPFAKHGKNRRSPALTRNLASGAREHQAR